LDMHKMSAIKWVDRKSMLACIEAGAVGKDIEKKLELYGLCLGHEPDSAEFSTLGLIFLYLLWPFHFSLK